MRRGEARQKLVTSVNNKIGPLKSPWFASSESQVFWGFRRENGPFSPAVGLATFRRKKPFSDDRATNLGARTRRQVAADKL
jgi:hypothetical protein